MTDVADPVVREGVLRVLGPRDLGPVSALLARNPVAHCFVAARINGAGLDAWRLGGEVWGWVEAGELVSAAYLGANFIPVETTPPARRAFAERARRVGRRCSSMVGPAEEVTSLWRLLEPSWGRAREIRVVQPLLALAGEPLIAGDPLVRRVQMDEVELLIPACVAMFTEEVGVSPLEGGGAESYRARIRELVRTGRAFARIEQGEIVFKAEIGAVTPQACQVQGVWVSPARRGEGLSGPGLAAVASLARELPAAPHVLSLYVNEFNIAARAAYARVGFDQVGTFSTILF